MPPLCDPQTLKRPNFAFIHKIVVSVLSRVKAANPADGVGQRLLSSFGAEQLDPEKFSGKGEEEKKRRKDFINLLRDVLSEWAGLGLSVSATKVRCSICCRLC